MVPYEFRDEKIRGRGELRSKIAPHMLWEMPGARLRVTIKVGVCADAIAMFTARVRSKALVM